MKIRKFLPLLLVIVHFTCSSAEFTGVIRGNRGIVWTNATYNGVSGSIAPTVWSLSQERATNRWYPGSFLDEVKQTIVFENFSGDHFSTSVELKGMEYLLGSSQKYFKRGAQTSDNPSFGRYPVCDITSDSEVSSAIGHKNSGCIENRGFVSDVRAEPFKFYRPNISIPELENVLKEQNLPSGRYSATFFATPFYLFQTESGVISQTQINEPIRITIDYTAAELESVVITAGDGIIEPHYDKGQKVVHGDTTYDIELVGTLPTGAIMHFVDFENDYSLLSDLDNESKIHYSFTCIQGCADKSSQDIIANGKFDKASYPDGNVLITAGENINRILTRYRIYYSVPESEVISSRYSGSINLYYEVNL